jgi:RNA polymerase sigma factor (TIGR02999 family)
MPSRRDVETVELQDQGDPTAAELDPNHRPQLDDFFQATYGEICRRAHKIKHSDPYATISTATLVHETWMKLAESQSLAPQSEDHLKCIVARAMRFYLVQAARRRTASKRGGPDAAVFVTLDESMKLPVSCDRDLLALDEAMNELARVNKRGAKLVEMRFYGGYDSVEAARLLGVSESTALRDWHAAKAWLAAQIRRGAIGS